MTDHSKEFQDIILSALDKNAALTIKGSGSKDFYGREIIGLPLQTTAHQGIMNYEPKELVMTARCGTPLSTIKNELAKEGQMLAFEPPNFTDNDTLGGIIACGFSGARRPYAGAARDFVLGTKIINGRGEILKFGGEVMKNVAGYDVSRLMVGSLGTLGLILDVSLKVLPIPEQEETCALECNAIEAIKLMNQWSSSKFPLSAACYDGTKLHFRISGTATAVRTATQNIGGEIMSDAAIFWRSISELKHDFFNHSNTENKALWRLSLAADKEPLNLNGRQLIDWGGAQRWLIGENNEQHIRQTTAAQGGHATLFRGGDRHGEVFHPLTTELAKLHIQLKRSFDPQGIFNAGRLYSDF